MIESAWIKKGHLLNHIDPDVRKITRFEHLHLKIMNYSFVWFSLFNGISTVVGHLMPKPFSKKNSSGTI